MSEDGAAELSVVIAGGESERCEFKPYIVLTDRDKSLEIEKTVCAFSNARGGHLFIGIDNEGEVVGLARELSRTGTSIEKAAEEYAGAIRKRLRENLSSNQCFAAEAMQLHGRTIIVIAVQPSTDTNYLLHSDQAYIRRGATSKKMSPPEIAAQLAAKQNHWAE